MRELRMEWNTGRFYACEQVLTAIWIEADAKIWFIDPSRYIAGSVDFATPTWPVDGPMISRAVTRAYDHGQYEWQSDRVVKAKLA